MQGYVCVRHLQIICILIPVDFSAKASTLLPPASLGHYTVLILPQHRSSEGKKTGGEGTQIFVSQYRFAVVQTGLGEFSAVLFPDLDAKCGISSCPAY